VSLAARPSRNGQLSDRLAVRGSADFAPVVSMEFSGSGKVRSDVSGGHLVEHLVVKEGYH